MVTMERTTVSVKHTKTGRGGGYILYWTLVRQLWHMMLNASDGFTTWQKIQMYGIAIAKTPWWLVLKPLGACLTVVRYYEGMYTLEDGLIAQNSVQKTTTWKLLGILPILTWKSWVTAEELRKEVIGEE